MHVDEEQRAEILELWRRGLSITMIATRTGIEYESVKYAISLARSELGREAVPFAKDIPGKSTKGRTISFSKTTTTYGDEGLLTWAGAFRRLAHFAKERGHDDVWEFAQEIANAKEMMTL